MKKLKLFFALFAMLALNVGNAWGETVTLNNLGAGLTTTSNTSVSTTKVGDYTLNYLQGKKQGNSILLAKGTNGGTSFISNKTPIPGAIQSVTVYINSGAAGKTTYHCAFSTTECTSKYTTGSTAVNITGGNSNKYTCSVANASYFCISLGNNNNGQVLKLEIEYTPASSGGSGETAASLTANPTTIDFGTKNIYFESEKQGSLEIEVTGQNLTGNVTAAISGNDATKFKLSSSSLTHNAGSVSEKLTVSYEVSEENEYSATLTLSSDGVDNVELPITLKVINEEPATYVKVTNAVTDGDYLIVYEEGNVAFNGALTTLDAISNTVAVEINNNIIVGNTEIDAATFTIASMTGGHSIQSKSGKYIGRTSGSNGMNTGNSAIANVITFSNGAVKVAGSGNGSTTSLQYNATSGQTRFRYFTTTQKAIALYKKASSHTVTIADCTNGSVSAKMGETALATNDQVLSGIQITLSNEAATGYKLAAYDVYKTDDATTKVTVTDGKFIMPEFDVTISATFELAKTLTSIEITTPATQTTFWQGETFNHDGLKITAHFDGAEDEDVTDKVTVTGSTDAAGSQTVTVSFKEGEVTKDATYTITVKAIPNTKETAYTVADAFDIIDKLGDTDKMYITGFVSQADLEQSSIDQYKNADYWISANGTTNGQQLEAFRGKYLDNTDFTSVNQILVGDEVIIYGKLTKYGSTYEFAAGNYLVSLKRDKQQPELSYTTTEYNVNLGEAFTAPTLNNPHSLAVTYSSNDEDVATVAVDGAVTIKAAGTVTITASFAGDENYVAGSASYTINITDPSISEATFVVNVDKGEKSITKNDITVEVSDGDLNREDNYRCYANQSMTISYTDGQITKIVITCTGSNTSNYGPGKLSTEDDGYSYSGIVGTWTGDAKSVTFKASAQVRMTKITVYYKQDKRSNSELAWSEESVSLTVGDAFTAPTFNNPNSVAPISFKSDNTNLATVNNAGAISLKAGAVGTATITASFAGNETYKDAEVKCTISVSPKTENVVILAQYAGKWYALKAEYVAEKTDRLVALPVEYINGTLYNVADADKALITWERVVIGNKATFKNGDNYLKGKSSTTLIIEGETTGLYQWDYPSYTMVIEGSTTVRTFLYSNTNNCFRNYDITNASDGIDEEKVYSSLPVVTAAKFEKATIITRSDLSAGNFGTICYENNITNFTGATFYEVAGKEGRKVIFDEVTELVAGMPYIFRAEAAELKIVLGQENTTTAGQHKSLQGTFEKIEDGEAGEAGNTLEGNYIIYNNFIKKCGAKCGLLGNRAYFIADALNNLTAPVSPAPGRKRVSMDVLGENEATGVDNITENGVIAPAMQGTYDVLGRQLSEPTATGFYIVNGKKVFVVK